MKKRALFVIFGFLLNSEAFAIVSLESLHFGDNAPGFKASITASANGLARVNGGSSASDRIRGEGTGTLQWNLEDSIYYLSTSGGYGKSGGKIDQNEKFLHARRIANITPKTAWEVFSQMEQDEFARLKLRAIGGGGLRFLLGERKPQQALFVGTGLFYSHELIDDDEDTIEKAIKGNIYLLFKRKLTKNAAFVNTIYVQPNVTSSNDFRILERATLKVSITNSIAIKLDVEVKHDNNPPADVNKTDIKYTTGFEYSF